MIKLGCKVKDKVTKLEGIAIARTEWLNGCIRICVQPKLKKDGTIPECVTLDEPQLEIIDDGIYVKKSKTGGPKPNPLNKETPRRS